MRNRFFHLKPHVHRHHARCYNCLLLLGRLLGPKSRYNLIESINLRNQLDVGEYRLEFAQVALW